MPLESPSPGYLGFAFLLGSLAPACQPAGPPGGRPAAELLRLRVTGLLEAERGTQDGYTRAAAAFARCADARGLPEDLLNLTRVLCLAGEWQEAERADARLRAGGVEVPADLLYLEGLIFEHTGRREEAITRFRTLAAAYPGVTAAWYRLGKCLMARKRDEEALTAFGKLLDVDPRHPGALYNGSLVLRRLGREEEAGEWLERHQELGPAGASGKEGGRSGTSGRSVKKVNAPSSVAFTGRVHGSDHGSDRDHIQCRFTRVSWVPVSRAAAEPPPVTFRFEELALPPAGGASQGGGEVRSVSAADLDGDGDQDLYLVGRGVNRLLKNGPAGLTDFTESSDAGDEGSGLLASPADYDGDSLRDLYLVNRPGPALLFRGLGEGMFQPLAVSPPAAEELAAARWVDYDHDGDLDLAGLQGEDAELHAVLYRNGGEGSFADVSELLSVTVAGAGEGVGFAVADLDRGNDIDFAFPHAEGGAVLCLNQRLGPFTVREVSELRGHARILAADLDGDGDADLVGAPRGEVPLRVAWNEGLLAGGTLQEGLRLEAFPPLRGARDARDALACDLDSDGDLDVLLATASGPVLLENREGGRLRERPLLEGTRLAGTPLVAAAAADLDGDLRLDLVLVTGRGEASAWLNRSAPRYEAFLLRLLGTRDNRDGVGAHVEVFAGRLYQRLLVEGSDGLRVGLGPLRPEEADGLAVLWPNGIRQSVLPGDMHWEDGHVLRVTQKRGLTASCPFLFVHDGRRYRFLTDIVGIAPLDEWAPPGASPPLDDDEHVRVPPGWLRPRRGLLRAAITEELREITYLDRISLLGVVHPPGIGVYASESTRQGGREPLRVWLVREEALAAPRAAAARPAAGSRAVPGRDGTALLAARDGLYFHPYREGRSQWAGWVEPFVLEAELPAALEGNASALLLWGRIAWQTSTVAYALHQHGRTWEPHRLDLLDADGQEAAGCADVGFPSGMDRTLVVPLRAEPGRRLRAVRLRSTSRLLWDRMAFAPSVAACTLQEGTAVDVNLDGDQVRLECEPLVLAGARLRYHGFSAPLGDQERHEQTFDFHRASSWRDFPLPRGRATRYGDVRSLLEEADDRLVVLVPGDGLFLQWEAGASRPARAAGRDREVTYFLRITGWAKESGFHNRTGREVEPLPHRAMGSYPEGARVPPAAPGYGEYLRAFQTRRTLSCLSW